MRNTVRVAVAIMICLVASGQVMAEPKPNAHNTYECLFCHKVQPRFGIDTRATVTFNDLSWDDPALCLRCHKPEENLHPLKVKPGSGGTVVPVNLELGSSGDSEGKVVCVTCHFIHAANADYALLSGFPGSQKGGLYKSWQELCRECHGATLESRSPHKGNSTECVFCHQSTPKKGAPVAVSKRAVELCNFCHGGLQNEHFADANPFKGDLTCSNCHDPHLGVDHPGRLRASYLDAVKNLVTVSPHYRTAFCASCHTDAKGPALLTEDPNALCERCHGTGLISMDAHPLKAIPAEMKVPKDWPLKDGKLTCLTCHRASHPADRAYPRFLRGGPYAGRNDICFGCHDRDSFQKKNPHLDINEMKGCDFCHADKPVPGKSTAKSVRFVAEISILCLRCHEESPHPGSFTHTVTPSPERLAILPRDVFPLEKGDRISCATCHNPHEGESENVKIRGGFGGFDVCTNCHKF